MYIFLPSSLYCLLAPWFGAERGDASCILVGGSADFQIQDLKGLDLLCPCCVPVRGRGRHVTGLDQSHTLSCRSDGSRFGGSWWEGILGQRRWRDADPGQPLLQQLCHDPCCLSSGALSSCLSFPCLFFQPLADAMDPDSLPVKSLHLEEPGSVSVACFQYCHGVERHSEHTHIVSSAHHPSQPPWSHVLKCTLGLTTEIDQRGWLVSIRTYLKKSSAEETGLKPRQRIWLAQNGKI